MNTVIFLLKLISFLFNKKNRLESHKKVLENKIFCNIVMISEDTKIFIVYTICYLCRSCVFDRKD